MEIQSYLEQSATAALLTTVVGTLGVLGTRIVSKVPSPLSSAISAGIASGIATAAAAAALEKTSIADQVKSYFPDSHLNFKMLSLMTSLFLSTLVLTPLTSRLLFKKSICPLGIFGLPVIAAACGTVAYLRFETPA